MTTTTSDAHNNTATSATTADGSILADSSMQEIEDECEERDLTNLTWLTELRHQSISFVNMPLDEDKHNEANPAAADAGEDQKTQTVPLSQQRQNMQELLQKSALNTLEQHTRRKPLQIQETNKSQEPQPAAKASSTNQPKRPSPTERYELFLNKIKRDLETYQLSAINYQLDITEKPPFNYSHIIGMAMLENGRRVTLQQICSWIEMKFAFFRVRKKWNNSIRHNLSLHPCFRKIGRNKEEKGKGGYWELGVDPKKCDRKRIRNRKSSSQASKHQNKHLHTYSKTSKKSQQNVSIFKKCQHKHFSDNIKSFQKNNKEYEYEELLLDDMDVQQNIDVTSTCTSSSNIITSTSSFYTSSEAHPMSESGQEESDNDQSFLTDLLKDSMNEDVNLEEFNNCQITTDHVHSHHQGGSPAPSTCQQEYKLGTIIISSTSMAELASIHNLNPSTLNSFLNAGSIKQLSEANEHAFQEQQQRRHHNILYTEDDIPQISESVIISSYMSNLSDNNYTTCTRESTKSNQSHPTNSSSSSSITLDFSTSANTTQPRPNVIVEQLMQPSLTLTAIGSSATPNIVRTSTNTPASSSITLTEASICDYPNLVNDNFRPYIDGIDEAFQYLRSIDNTRNEDILDNLLDISVSDY